MCVIAYKPADIPVDMKVLKHCWDKNDDGAGLMFAENGKLKVAKGFMKWRSFKRYLKRRGLDTLTGIPVAFHFRIATHGSVNENNCHPFQINENLAMMHNGVIRKVDNMIGDDDISDSEFFANRYVKGAFSVIGIDDLKGGTPINELYDEYIGASKLLFMDNTGDIAIVNERSGTWPNFSIGKGWWFSNTHWRPVSNSQAYSNGSSASIIKYSGDFRIVEIWEHGRKVVKKYSKKTGTLLSTTYAPKSLSSVQAESDAEQKHVGKYRPNKFELDDEDWYCLDCHAFFWRSEAKRSYWTNGLTKRIVDCPECGGSNTCESEYLYAEPVDDEVHLCYLCGSESYADELLVTATGEKKCNICYSTNVYKEEERHLVERFGADYFKAEVIEKEA